MLINTFFKIKEQKLEDNKIIFIIQLIENHPIYIGHFPKNPIVPGVCSIEIIKECAAYYLKTHLKYTSIEQCKFLNPINPLKNRNLIVSINILPIGENEYSLSGTITDQNIPFVTVKCKTIKPL